MWITRTFQIRYLSMMRNPASEGTLLCNAVFYIVPHPRIKILSRSYVSSSPLLTTLLLSPSTNALLLTWALSPKIVPGAYINTYFLTSFSEVVILESLSASGEEGKDVESRIGIRLGLGDCNISRGNISISTSSCRRRFKLLFTFYYFL